MPLRRGSTSCSYRATPGGPGWHTLAVPDDMAPDMRETLDLLWVTARDAFGYRRGSADAREYAEKVERAYGSDPDASVRREIAEICEFLRNP